MTIKISELFGDSEVENLQEAVKDRLGEKYVIVEEEDHIPKSRFETIRQENKEIKDQLEERDGQLENLKKQAKGNEELEQTIKELQEENEQKIEEYENKLKQTKLDMAIENKLIKEKARNPKAVKALLNEDAISLDDDGELVGLSEQLEKLKKEEDYMFGETGLEGEDHETGDGNVDDDIKNNPWETGKVNLTKQAELLKESPGKAKKLIKKAGLNPSDYGLN